MQWQGITQSFAMLLFLLQMNLDLEIELFNISGFPTFHNIQASQHFIIFQAFQHFIIFQAFQHFIIFQAFQLFIIFQAFQLFIIFQAFQLFIIFQAFQHFSQEYSDSSFLVARLIYSFIVSCSYHVTVTSSSVFQCYYYCLLACGNNLCSFHI